MVLSNKKLKEKRRAAKELLDPITSKSVIDSVVTSQKKKKSKRDKRREEKALSLQQKEDGLKEHQEEDGGPLHPQGTVIEQKKKRKRVESGEKGKGDGQKELQEQAENEARPRGTASGKNKDKKRKRDETETKTDEQLNNEKTRPIKNKKKKKKKKKKKNKKKVEDGDVVKNNEDVVKNNGDGGNGENQESAAADPTKMEESSGNVSNKVYVGGIPYYSTEDDIRSFFEGCGTITKLDCMNFPDTGKFRGIVIITFKTEAAAKRAMALDGADMGGLFLKIQSYKSARANKMSNFSPNMVEGYNRVYVGNLSWNISEDDLKKLFSDCSISSIRFGEDKETGEFRGYAHVDFADSQSVTVALKLDQKIVCGRPVRISCAVAKEGAVKKGVYTNSRPPKDQNADTVHSQNADGVPTSAVSAKIRRRTCYECGERGHLSSSCPKKKETDQTEQVAS